MRPARVIALFAGLSAALSWEGVLEDSAAKAVAGLENVEQLFRRQNEGDAATTETSATNTRQTTAATGTRTGTATGSRGTITGSARLSASGTAEATGAATSSEDVDPRQPPGGVSMQVPGVFESQQFYKVGDWVTFGWNYTSVVNKPSAVNVIAQCSQIGAEWTIAANMSYEANQTVYWDTAQYNGKQTPQLVVASYTLIIENADQSKATGIPQAGALGSQAAYRFAMYTPQEYVPFSDFTCPMCNSAPSQRQAAGLMFAMASITILSFTWFATGSFGVF